MYNNIQFQRSAIDGSGCVIYLDSAVMRRLDRLARQFAGQGGFSQAEDQLGRSVLKYKNAELRDPALWLTRMQQSDLGTRSGGVV